jgi:hypothetical protein
MSFIPFLSFQKVRIRYYKENSTNLYKFLERWQSGRMRSPRKRLFRDEWNRGFESPSLLQICAPKGLAWLRHFFEQNREIVIVICRYFSRKLKANRHSNSEITFLPPTELLMVGATCLTKSTPSVK